MEMTFNSFNAVLMMYLAGLQGIPQELCEAATIDGANAVKVFTRIKLQC